jgi:hypothetical protein
MPESQNLRDLERVLNLTLINNFSGVETLYKAGKNFQKTSQNLFKNHFEIAKYKFVISESEISYDIIAHVSVNPLFIRLVDKRFKKTLRELHSKIKTRTTIDINYSRSFVEPNEKTPYGIKTILHLPKVR